MTVHCGVTQLLRRPVPGGASRGCYMKDSSRALVHREEEKQGPEQQVVGLHEIAAPNIVSVVRDERRPGLPLTTRPPGAQVLLDGAFADPMTSLRSSPRIRSLPQRGLSRAIVAISWRTSGLSRGRPSRERDRHRQKSRQPCRCQRITVSGRTTAKCSRQCRQRSRASTQKTLSHRRNRGRFRVGRVKTASCCRSKRFSAANSARPPTAARTTAVRSRR